MISYIALDLIKNKKFPINVKMPPWADEWIAVSKKTLSIDDLYARVWDENTNKLIAMPINRTPHYKFIKEYMKYGDSFKCWESGYFAYANKYINGKESINHFLNLYHDIKNKNYLKDEYKANLCLVYRRFAFENYYIFDGVHRLAILAAIGISKLEVAVVTPKKLWLFRLMRKFYKWANLRTKKKKNT